MTNLHIATQTNTTTTAAADPPLSIDELFDLLEQAGFQGAGLIIGVATVFGESGGRPLVTNTNGNGSIDRGIWQINDGRKGHPEVTADCAFNPQCATKEAFRISKGGTDFHEWYAYKDNSDGYQRGLRKALKTYRARLEEGRDLNPPVNIDRVVARLQDLLDQIAAGSRPKGFASVKVIFEDGTIG